MKVSELTLKEANSLTDLLTQAKEHKSQVVKKRDELEALLKEVQQTIDALSKVLGV
jgi:hypothetical protein